jgi:hypothetical protein
LRNVFFRCVCCSTHSLHEGWNGMFELILLFAK